MTTKTNKGFALNLINNDKSEEVQLSERLKLVEKPIPELQKGEVLVKIHASPINPSDLVYLMGKYGIPAVDGAFAGFEACGTIVEANAGLYGKWLKGKRVAIFATPGKDGVWADYAITKIQYCIPVRKELSDEQASTIVVNPCTSVCLVDRASQLKAKTIVINAAASQVGKGVIRYAKLAGIKTIATVRSEANVNILKELGADQVLLTTDDNYTDELKKLCHEMNATVFIDAVADLDTPEVLGCMPRSSTGIVYGRLTDTHNPIGGYFNVADLIFRDIKLEGFWLSTHIKKLGPIGTMRLTKKVQKLFADGVFETDIYGTYGFSNFLDGLEHYADNKSDGKVILVPENT